MNPLRLRATNYRTFEELDLDLPNGCCAIVGENGAGKSSIVNVIDLALFGPQSRTLADHLTDDAIDTELMVELEFEHAGELYRVRRCYSARGRGKTTVDFERFWTRTPEGDPIDEWGPLTRETAKATDQLIEQTIGLSRETFRASAFLAQGDGAAFTEAQPRDRKRILAEVLGLSKWDGLLELAKRDRGAAQQELQHLEGETAAARVIVETKEQVERDHDVYSTIEREAGKDLAVAEADLAAVLERYQVAREQASRRQAAEAEHRAAAESLERLTEQAEKIGAASVSIENALAELATLPTPEQLAEAERVAAELEAYAVERAAALQARDAAERLLAERERECAELERRAGEHEAKFEQLRQHANDLEATPYDEATCDRCRQQLAGNARAIAVDSLVAEANGHAEQAEQLREQVSKIEFPELPALPEGEPREEELGAARHRLKVAQELQQVRARLEERVRNCETEIASAPDIGDRIVQAVALVNAKAAAVDELEPVDLAAVEGEGHRTRAAVAEERERLEKARIEKARVEERLERIRQAEQQLAAAAKRGEQLHDELDLCVTLERAFGRDGIPTLIVENAAIPQIESTANTMLQRLGGKTAAAHVELRTQSANKTNDHLRDTLDILVITEDGSEREYLNWSGGEKSRINLALRMALAELLATRRGAESRIFVIDEIDGLDAAGKYALLEILQDLHARGLFERVYLVSHDVDLRDAFEQTIEVQIDGACSFVVDAAEAVAA